jgi:hypothetical protein
VGFTCDSRRRRGSRAQWYLRLASGSALLLGIDWAQLFDIRDFARRAPDTLNALNAGHGPNLSDIGGLVVLGTFTIGWLAIAAVTIRTRMPSRVTASVVLIGFFLIPILRPVLPGLLGPIVGKVVFDSSPKIGVLACTFPVFDGNRRF